MSRVIDEHRLYLRDSHRLAAYERAIREVVKPGDIVVDLASGTGILGLFACRAGAGRVYAIEQEGIVGLAREIAKANGFERTVVGIRGYSGAVKVPEPADVVVCDQIGGFGLEADIVDRAREVRSRFLRPGGTFVPSRLELLIAAVEHHSLHERINFWETRPADFDFKPAIDVAANTGYPARLRPRHLLSPGGSAGTIDLMAEVSSPVQVATSVVSTRDGVLHGVCGWFAARLSPGVTMTNSPLCAERIRRRPIFFPIQEALPITKGTTVDVAMRILPSDGMYAWDVRVRQPSGSSATFRHTTLRGMLLAREDLERTNPLNRPSLTSSGIARLTVLRLCDGQHTLGEIERGVFEAHPDLFQSQSEAATLVAEVVTRYGR